VAAHSREDADVTFLVSATPVFGIGPVEAIQFWSRKFNKENYAYDPEAWRLERSTFQHFLEAVGAMQRIVALSGDVHYAFGSSVKYWDHRAQRTAKIVNYTSSALRNEGTCARIASLARGYPAFLRLAGRREEPAVRYSGQDTPDEVGTSRHPEAAQLPTQGEQPGLFDTISLDQTYQMRYLRDLRSQAPGFHEVPEQAMASSSLPALLPERAHSLVYGVLKGEHLLARRAGAAEHLLLHPREWLNEHEAGILIVGYANIGDISVQWSPDKKEVIQRLWWCHPDDPEQLIPRTEYRESLDLPGPEAIPPLHRGEGRAREQHVAVAHPWHR
jgi:hypothetical protein